MDEGGSLIRHFVIFHLTGLGIELVDRDRTPVIGDPNAAVFGWVGVPGHATRAWHLVLHVDNLHGLIAKVPHHPAVFRHVGGRSRQHRSVAEKAVDVIGYVVSLLRGQKR
jgi:hypothetical protein